MSTGDQSQYVRSKLAERGSTRGAKFMKDGFDTWAETEAPAREGQMSKIPSEVMEDNYGGAMTVRHAKKMLHGGSALSDAVDAAKKIVNFWREASRFIDDFDEELEYQIIRGPRSSPGLKKFARDLRDVIAGIRTSKSMLDGVAALAGTVGLGKNGQMRGGMTMQEAGQYVSEIMKWFKFLFQAYNNVMAILEMDAFKFLKPQITNAFNMIKGAVGLGKSCCCDDESPKVGGRRRGGMLSMSGVPAASEPIGRKVGGRRVGSGLIDDLMMEQKKRAMKAQGGRRVGGKVFMSSDVDDADETSMVGIPSYKTTAHSEGSQMLGSSRRGGFYDFITPDKYVEKQPKLGPGAEMMARAMEKMPKGGRSCGGRKPSARGAIVKQVMQQQGLSLPQASKYVKEHGLY
jgi:hypothetical protein